MQLTKTHIKSYFLFLCVCVFMSLPHFVSALRIQIGLRYFILMVDHCGWRKEKNKKTIFKSSRRYKNSIGNRQKGAEYVIKNYYLQCRVNLCILEQLARGWLTRWPNNNETVFGYFFAEFEIRIYVQECFIKINHIIDKKIKTNHEIIDLRAWNSKKCM